MRWNFRKSEILFWCSVACNLLHNIPYWRTEVTYPALALASSSAIYGTWCDAVRRGEGTIEVPALVAFLIHGAYIRTHLPYIFTRPRHDAVGVAAERAMYGAWRAHALPPLPPPTSMHPHSSRTSATRLWPPPWTWACVTLRVARCVPIIRRG